MDFRIRLDQLKQSPLRLERDLPVRTLDELLLADPPTGFSARGDAAFRGRLSKVRHKDVVFEGDFPLPLRTTCKRCLGPVDVEVPIQFTLDLVRRERAEDRLLEAMEDDGQGEIAGTFTPDEAEEVIYDGQEVDLGPVIREQILLALPMGAICSDACKGLCQICGANLNEAACACDRHVPDPRWAALRSIKLAD